MPKTRLLSPGSIPNHRLLKSLQLQDNYISNDGGDEGISINNSGEVSLNTRTHALQFNSTDEYILCPDIDAIEGIAALSIGLWVYFDHYGDVGHELVTKGSYHDSSSSWSLQVDNSDPPRIEFSVSNSVFAFDGNELNVKQWYHLVVTYSDTADDIAMYLDGSALTLDSEEGSFITVPSTSKNVKIGAGDNNLYFGGRMREVALWDVALDAAAVTALYNGGTSVNLSANSGNYDNSGDLIAYWKMDEGTGTSLADSHPTNNHTGTATNMDNTNWVSGNPDPVLIAENDSIQINNQLKLSYNTTDNAVFQVDDDGKLNITPSGSNTIFHGDIAGLTVKAATTQAHLIVDSASATYTSILSFRTGGSAAQGSMIFNHNTSTAGDRYLDFRMGDQAVSGSIYYGDGTLSVGQAFMASAYRNAKLDVLSTTGEQLRLKYDATNYAGFTVAADGALTIATADADAAEADIILAPDGKVGIGETAPAADLEIKGNLSAALSDSTSVVTDGASGTNRYVASDSHGLAVGDAVRLLDTGESAGGDYSIFSVATVTDADNFIIDSNGDAAEDKGQAYSDSDLFGVRTGDDASKFLIDNSGNVGIGVADPDALLEIFGLASNSTQCKFSYDTDSFATIKVAQSSHTTIATGESGNIILDAAGDLTLDAAGGDVTVLQADLTIPVDKKVIYGNAGEYIVGDNTDLDIISSNDIMFGNGTVDYTQIQNAGMNFYTSGVGHQVIKIASGTPSIRLVSLLDSADYATIAGGVNGILAITTVDGVGNDANISIVADGWVKLGSAAGEEILLAAGAGGYTKIDGDLDNTSAGTNTGLYVDFDRVGAVTSGTDRNIGINLDVNATGAGTSGTPTVYTMGIDMDVVGDAAGSGTSTVTGLDLNVSGGDTNYAIITTGGNVGIGEAAPQDTLEVNGTVLVKDALKFTQDDGNEFIDSQNDGYLDIGATTSIRLEAPTLCEDKLYFTQTDGNEYIDSLNDGYLDIDATNAIRLGVSTGFAQVTASFDATDTDIDFRTGNKQILTLTADITDVHFQFPSVSGNFLCIFLQDGTGGWDVSNWKTKDSAGNAGNGNSGEVLWPGDSATTLTETADKADIISIYWDATNEKAYAVASENF